MKVSKIGAEPHSGTQDLHWILLKEQNKKDVSVSVPQRLRHTTRVKTLCLWNAISSGTLELSFLDNILLSLQKFYLRWKIRRQAFRRFDKIRALQSAFLPRPAPLKHLKRSFLHVDGKKTTSFHNLPAACLDLPEEPQNTEGRGERDNTKPDGTFHWLIAWHVSRLWLAVLVNYPQKSLATQLMDLFISWTVWQAVYKLKTCRAKLQSFPPIDMSFPNEPPARSSIGGPESDAN